MLLTIGMPAAKNFDEVYFTVQALRLYHDLSDCEILVVDNAGDDKLKKWIRENCRSDCRYVRCTEKQGTAPAKNAVFQYAFGDFVLCIDSHIFLYPGVVKRLKNWIKNNQSGNLIYGTLAYDSLKNFVYEMKPIWRGEMFGIWGDYFSEDKLPTDPIEIWGHGGGCFGCMRDAWLGFNSAMTGFGGEEGYLSEKYRQHGHKVLSLPWLKWVHHFNGTKRYRLHVRDKIRNYLIGFRELGLDARPILDHFGRDKINSMRLDVYSGIPSGPVTIKSFNGIGDLLFVTPTLRRIKEADPDIRITVNTNYPELLDGNPYVDEIGTEDKGVFLGYPDPIHRKQPTQHHILSSFEIVKEAYSLDIKSPELKPEIYIDISDVKKTDKIGVQTIHKGHWYQKKVWPFFDELSLEDGFEAIPKVTDARDLVRQVASYRAVVCAEGGISHIARALDVPAVVIFGGFASPDWSGYPEHINLFNRKDCSYCYNPDECSQTPERACMRDISIADVKAAIKKMQCESTTVCKKFGCRRGCQTDSEVFTKCHNNPKLNLGSGDMLMKDYINFDINPDWKRNGLTTDVVGDINDALTHFQDSYFEEVFCAHVIEHFRKTDAIELLKIFFKLLRPSGKAVLEGPDMIGAYEYYVDRLKDVNQYIDMVFGKEKDRIKYGAAMTHRSGWTKETMAAAMKEVGFEVAQTGIGLSHGFGSRDFRVEGVKPCQN